MNNNDYVWDFYRYNVHTRNDSETNYVCCQYKHGQCHGRGTERNGEFTVTQMHTHGPDKIGLKVRDLKKDLFIHVTTSTDKYRDIYDRLRPSHPLAAKHLPFCKVENNMRKWRKKFTPPTPNSMISYEQIINSNEWDHTKQYDTGKISVSRIIAADLSQCILYCDKNFANSVCLNSDKIFVDATYKVVPSGIGAYQLVTFMTINFNHAFPFAWALMEKKSSEAYESVIQELKNTLTNFNFTEAMCDYELGVHGALRNVFPGITVHGCLFHYNQALYKKVKFFGLKRILIDTDEGYTFLRRLMALALLPQNEIRVTYLELCHSLSLQTRMQIKRYIKYFEKYWLRKVTPEVFSVYMLHNRTNNVLESYHRQLKLRFGVHPQIWTFTNKLVDLQQGLKYDMGALRCGHAISRARKLENVLKDVQIIEYWTKLQEPNRPTSIEFLDKMVRVSINPIDEFENSN